MQIICAEYILMGKSCYTHNIIIANMTTWQTYFCTWQVWKKQTNVLCLWSKRMVIAICTLHLSVVCLMITKLLD